MLTLIRIELYKIFMKWRTYIGFFAVLLLVIIIQIAISYEGERALGQATRGIQHSFVFVGNFLNGYFVSQIILNALYIHIPFLITLVAGDLMAGEANAGTYRMTMTRPVSRFSFVTSKFLAGIIYTALLIFWLAVLSLGIGILIFGTGELLTLKGSVLIIFSRSDILWRFILVYLYAIVSMSVVTSIAFIFSSFVANSIGPIITTMAIIITFMIISAIDIDVFHTIKPFLFTNYMGDWNLFLDKPVDYAAVWNSILILLAHIAALYGITLFFFSRKDILT